MAKNKKEMTPEERLAAALVPEEEQPYELPKGWKWVRIGKIFIDVTDSQKKIKQKEYLLKGKWPVIDQGQHFIGGYSDADELIYTDELPVIIFGDHTRNVKYIDFQFIQGADGVKVLKPQSFIYSKFLFWLLKGLPFPSLGYRRHFPVLKKMFAPLPPLDEQQRLVARIESLFAKLDAAKEKVQAVLDAHETRKAALLHEAIAGNLIGAGEKELKPLSEIVDLIRIGPFGSALHKEDYIQGGIPVVNPQHIVNQVICPDSRKSISESKADSLAVYKMCVNDIIIGRRGEMGRTAPVGEDEAGWLCGTGCMLLRLKKEYDAKFYSLVIASQKSKQYLETHAVGSTMKNLNEKIIRNLPVPVYSYAEQQEIVAVLDRLLGREEEVRQSAESVLAAIDSMKQSILARAFRGELGV